VIFKLKKETRRIFYNLACRNILKTSPINRGSVPVTIVSLLSRQDIVAYLLAIKSLSRRIGLPQGVHVINDGSLAAGHERLLKHHVPFLKIVHVYDISTGKCPRHLCWPRLCYVVDLSQESYVLQMDSDTLTLDALNEVCDCISSNRSFILGTKTGQHLEDPEATSRRARSWNVDHVQVFAERQMKNLPGCGLRYVRGSAGFAGFAKGGFSREKIEEFSTSMETLVGADKWASWGSEQVTSNLSIANSNDPLVLRSPKYVNHVPNEDVSKAAFIHFIGKYRYQNGVYSRMSKNIVDELHK
jgi:hypothetical protein